MSDLCDQLRGRDVVLDVNGMYVYLGTLTGWDEKSLTLEPADVHDLRDTATSRERYILDSRLHGIRANRQRVHVRWDEVVSFSALADVLV